MKIIQKNFKEYSSLEEYDVYLHEKYNTSSEVGTMKEEDQEKFLNEIISLGIYSWQDEYKTNEVIDDGAESNFTIFFTDGTFKTTNFYYEYPKNYTQIVEAFFKYFHLNCWR